MPYTEKIKVKRGKTTYFRERAERKTGETRIAGKKIDIYESKNYVHYRINPKAKGETRVLDIGEPKRHQLIRVKTKKGWVTRSVRVQKNVSVSPTETKEILRKAVLYQQ
ncbi:MAG: hypothetical protein ACFFDN_06965 [Candidatus Hodarchaeota archaeon]